MTNRLTRKGGQIGSPGKLIKKHQDKNKDQNQKIPQEELEKTRERSQDWRKPNSLRSRRKYLKSLREKR